MIVFILLNIIIEQKKIARSKPVIGTKKMTAASVAPFRPYPSSSSIKMPSISALETSRLGKLPVLSVIRANRAVTQNKCYTKCLNYTCPSCMYSIAE